MMEDKLRFFTCIYHSDTDIADLTYCLSIGSTSDRDFSSISNDSPTSEEINPDTALESKKSSDGLTPSIKLSTTLSKAERFRYMRQRDQMFAITDSRLKWNYTGKTLNIPGRKSACPYVSMHPVCIDSSMSSSKSTASSSTLSSTRSFEHMYQKGRRKRLSDLGKDKMEKSTMTTSRFEEMFIERIKRRQKIRNGILIRDEYGYIGVHMSRGTVICLSSTLGYIILLS